MTQILIADDHPLFRLALTQALRAIRGRPVAADRERERLALPSISPIAGRSYAATSDTR